MVAHFARLAGLTAVLATLIAVPAHAAQFRVGVQVGVPAPVVVAPPPVYGGPVVAPYGYVWQPGYYVTVGYGRRWVPGAWVRRAYVPRGYAYGYWRGRSFERERFDRFDRRWRR